MVNVGTELTQNIMQNPAISALLMTDKQIQKQLQVATTQHQLTEGQSVFQPQTTTKQSLPSLQASVRQPGSFELQNISANSADPGLQSITGQVQGTPNLYLMQSQDHTAAGEIKPTVCKNEKNSEIVPETPKTKKGQLSQVVSNIFDSRAVAVLADSGLQHYDRPQHTKPFSDIQPISIAAIPSTSLPYMSHIGQSTLPSTINTVSVSSSHIQNYTSVPPITSILFPSNARSSVVSQESGSTTISEGSLPTFQTSNGGSFTDVSNVANSAHILSIQQMAAQIIQEAQGKRSGDSVSTPQRIPSISSLNVAHQSGGPAAFKSQSKIENSEIKPKLSQS